MSVPVRRASLAGFWVALALLVLVGALAYRSITALVEDVSWVSHTHEVLSAVAATSLALAEAESGVRGFLLSLDERMLEPQAAARQELPALQARLRALTMDNPQQQARLARLEGLVASRLALLDARVAERRAGRIEGAATEQLDEGRAAGEALRAALLELQSAEQALLAERRATVQAGARAALLGMALCGGLAAAAAGSGLMHLRRTDQALRTYAEDARDLFDHAPCGYHTLGPDGTFQRVNDTELRWLGRTRDELVGQRRFSELLVPESAALYEAALAELESRGEVRDLELDLQRNDGRPLSVLLSASVLEDGQGRLANSRATLFDLTDRRRVERERDRFFLLSQDLLVVSNLEGVFERANPAWQATLGYTPAEMKSLPWAEWLHPDDRSATLRVFERQLSGETVRGFENRYRHRDGHYVWLQWTSQYDGDSRRIFAIARDVTAQRRAIDEIRAAKEATEAANRELETFSYSVSHDLRAPLRHIRGFTDLLQRHAAQQLDERGRHYLDVIAVGARRMGQLIDDLLAFSRMGRTELRKTRVDLSALTRQVLAELEPQSAGRELEVTLGRLPEVAGDHALLRVVLTNLLSNAFKYTGQRPRAHVEVGAREEPGEQVVFVRDDGVGFDMQYAGKLFGVFQRLHGTEEFEGTGIGLATVRRIVHRHGGRVWAEAQPDRGATFFFSLPHDPSAERGAALGS